MTLEILKSTLMWCTIIHFGILLLWFVSFVAMHDWLFKLHSRWFHISHETFDAIHYAGIALYKFGILLFNLVPWLALWLVTSS